MKTRMINDSHSDRNEGMCHMALERHGLVCIAPYICSETRFISINMSMEIAE